MSEGPKPQRYAAGVEYAGTAYAGWQKLSHNRSVQAEVERALSLVANHPVQVGVAGRTDAGVHALQQVIHFDSPSKRSDYGWLLGVNTNLPADINLIWVQPVREDFHARYLAFERSYRYVIHNQSARSSLLKDRATWWPRQLDAEAMHRAAQVLVGENDFSSFRDADCQSPTPMRRLDGIKVFRRGHFVVMDVLGNAFLHHMIRNIAGTLAAVGWGDKPEAWVAEVLALRSRREAGITAPAAGLYFIGPRYPAEFALPPPPEPWFPA